MSATGGSANSRSASERGARAEGPGSPSEQGRRHLTVNTLVKRRNSQKRESAPSSQRTAFQDAFPSSPREARKADFRQKIQDSGNHFLECRHAVRMPDLRPAQSAALEGDVHANLRVTPHFQEADALERAAALYSLRATASAQRCTLCRLFRLHPVPGAVVQRST